MNPHPASRYLLFVFSLFWLLTACTPEEPKSNPLFSESEDTVQVTFSKGVYTPPLPRDVIMREYFCFIDSVVAHYDSLTKDSLTEHLLVNANPWIIDTLVAQDYYQMMERGIFVEDNRDLVVLKKGDSLLIPGHTYLTELQEKAARTYIDVNIPEFRLRIVEGEDTLWTFQVRVGQYRTRYLATAGGNVDLRTHHGEGKMVRHARDPIFIDPCDGERFTHTRRDDGKTTFMPLIPWMEPEIDGVRYGQLIHPTTNPKSLNKAYSNGCVGTREGAAWRIYYAAPLGTRVLFRYDLLVPLENGDTLELENIYQYKNR